MTKWKFNEGRKYGRMPLGAFCNIFDLHLAIIRLENQFLIFLRVAVLDRFYCILFMDHFEGCLMVGKIFASIF